MKSIASFGEETPRIGKIGPKISSLINLESTLGSTTSVGSIYLFVGSVFPPNTMSDPIFFFVKKFCSFQSRK